MKTLFAIIITVGFASVGFSEPTNAVDSSQGQTDHLSTRTYTTEVFFTNLKQQLPPKDGESDQQLVLRYFKQNKIEIEKPSAVFVNNGKHQLYVRTSPADQEKIEALIVKLQPVQTDSPEALLADGKLSFEMGKLVEAEQKFQKILEMEPDNAKARYYLDQVHLAQKASH